MNVSVRDIDTAIDLGNNGIILEIRDNDGNFVGKLRIGKATVEWCAGKTHMGRGHMHRLESVIAWLAG